MIEVFRMINFQQYANFLLDLVYRKTITFFNINFPSFYSFYLFLHLAREPWKKGGKREGKHGRTLVPTNDRWIWDHPLCITVMVKKQFILEIFYYLLYNITYVLNYNYNYYRL